MIQRLKLLIPLMVIFFSPSNLMAIIQKREIIHVYQGHHFFEDNNAAFIPANESVATYVNSLNKGGWGYPLKYECDVKYSVSNLGDVNGGIMYHMKTVFDIRDCKLTQ